MRIGPAVANHASLWWDLWVDEPSLVDWVNALARYANQRASSPKLALVHYKWRIGHRAECPACGDTVPLDENRSGAGWTFNNVPLEVFPKPRRNRPEWQFLHRWWFDEEA